jgi:hypothetical protein
MCYEHFQKKHCILVMEYSRLMAIKIDNQKWRKNMALMKTNRPYYHAISIVTFCVSMLQSSMLMAASSGSEDPIPAAVSIQAPASTRVQAIIEMYNGMGLSRMVPRGAGSSSKESTSNSAVPSAPPKEPAVNAGASTAPGNAIPSDVASVLSDHGSDDETFRELIAEARSVSLHWDKGVKQTIRGKRIQKKLDIAAAKQAELDGRRAAFLAKLGEPLRTKEVPAGAASSAAAGSASSAMAADETALAAEGAASDPFLASGGSASSSAPEPVMVVPSSDLAVELTKVEAPDAAASSIIEGSASTSTAAPAPVDQAEIEAHARQTREAEVASILAAERMRVARVNVLQSQISDWHREIANCAMAWAAYKRDIPMYHLGSDKKMTVYYQNWEKYCERERACVQARVYPLIDRANSELQSLQQ